MGAYATDVVEKLWPTNYGGRGTPYLSEGGCNIRDQYGNFSAPPLGYMWDFAKRANVIGAQLRRVRDRGAGAAAKSAPTCPASKDWFIPHTRRSILSVPDQQPRRHLARGVPPVRARRQASAALDHPSRQRSHQRHDARARRRRARWSPTTTSRSAGSSRPSRTAGTGKSRRSSSSKTMRRTARITSTRTDPVLLSVSPFSRSARRSTARCTRPRRAAHDGADSRACRR